MINHLKNGRFSEMHRKAPTGAFFAPVSVRKLSLETISPKNRAADGFQEGCVIDTVIEFANKLAMEAGRPPC